MSCNIGKGIKNSLKQLYMINKTTNTKQIYIKRDNIKIKWLRLNTKNYLKAHAIHVYSNKIHNKSIKEKFCNKIFERDISKEQVKKNVLYSFLSLLKTPQSSSN